VERIAFTMRVKPGQEAEYRRRHADVWPEMRRALKDAGCSNYSIYMKGRDLFAYMELDDFHRFKRLMSDQTKESEGQLPTAARPDRPG
jgi:L-rhamnose mutarotase